MEWKDRIAVQYEKCGGTIIDGPVSLTCDFYFDRPQTGKAAKKLGHGKQLRPLNPDIDNLLKAVMDGLNLVAWTDDRQVCVVKAVKWYRETNGAARAELCISKID